MYKTKIKKFLAQIESSSNEKTTRIKYILKFFYVFLFYLSISSYSSIGQTTGIKEILNAEIYFDALWPLFWINSTNYSIALTIIWLSFTISSLLSIFYALRFRGFRILSFITFFLYLSAIFSFGKIDHYYHLVLMVSFMLIFIPNFTIHKKSIPKLNLIFWYTQIFILASYSSSGFYKIWGIIDQILLGEKSALNPDALPFFVAKTSLAINSETLFGHFFVSNSGYLFSFLILIAYLIEFFSIAIAFLPKFHRIWGLILILFHIGILLSIGADFKAQIIVVALFLVMSPFHQKKYKLD